MGISINGLRIILKGLTMVFATKQQHTKKHDLHLFKSWTLTPRQSCDLECILMGAFAPLQGFMTEEHYQSVCKVMRLGTGELWPIPVVLDFSDVFAHSLCVGETIVLRSQDNTPLAWMTIQSLWQPNKEVEAMAVYGTTNLEHPGVRYLKTVAGDWYAGGPIQVLREIKHDDFIEHRLSPSAVKTCFQLYGWERIVAFQTRNPIHRAHFELTQRAAKQCNGALLIQPVVGLTKTGDIDYVTRVQCYLSLLERYQTPAVMLNLLPLAMRMAGPREAVWHGLIRKNYGATHFIIGRDHAGPGMDSQKKPFYSSEAAQTLFKQYADEIGLQPIFFSEMVYVPTRKSFCVMDDVKEGETVATLSGTQLRRQLETGEPLPEWFTFPEIQTILQRAYPPQKQRGWTLLLTGLSGAGKSTLAKALMLQLQIQYGRTVSLLDGDDVRKNLSGDLGFLPHERETHLRRVGWLAAEITKHRGVALIAAIAPYYSTRRLIRDQVEPYGQYFEVFVDTPIQVCKERDVKGLYQQAEAGLISHFTGVNDPYERPELPDCVVDTSMISVADAVDLIMNQLREEGWL